jgi:predicted transcriptional regulator
MITTALRPTTQKIDQSIKGRVQRLAELRHRPASGLMIEVIRDYVEREEKREAFRQDGIRTWNDYQETGLHVTSDEVVAWLETWGEVNEKAAPLCHR